MFCDGIDGYTIYNSIDPSPQAHKIAEIDASHPINNKCKIISQIQPKAKGCAGNTYESLKLGFENGNADFVIHLEDDDVMARDFIRFMETLSERFVNDPNIFVIVGYNYRTDSIDNEEFQKQLPYFGIRPGDRTYRGWGTWRRIWDEVKNNWFGIHWKAGEPAEIPEGDDFMKVIKKSNDGSWAWPMLKYHRGNRQEVFPVISRIQNIGETRGRFNPNPEWHRKNVYTKLFADRAQYNGEYLYYPNYPK